MRSGSIVSAFSFLAILTSGLAMAAPERPEPVSRVQAVYPEKATAEGVSGNVEAVLTVDERGAVTDVSITTERPLDYGFAEAADAAFRQWRYPPGEPGKYPARMKFRSAPVPQPDDYPAAPRPTKRIPPEYPARALAVPVEGNVIVVLDIDSTGNVESALVDRELPKGFGFGDAAVDAVSNWTFQAGVPGKYQIEVRFYLPGSKGAVMADFDNLPPAPAPTTSSEPRFPSQARGAGVTSGKVRMALRIGDEGRVTHATVVNETPTDLGFGSAVYKSVVRWRFRDAEAGVYMLDVVVTDEN